MGRIIVFDTTLRDGEQAPGASLTAEQKLEIALQLERLGVDVIEAGFPIASRGDFVGVQNIAKRLQKSIVCGLARSLKKDIEAAHEATRPAKKSRIHVFLATSKIHMKYKLKKAEDEIVRLAVKATKLARNYCDDIEFSPEDASRTEKDFLYRVLEAVIAAGARTVNIPDTVGWSYPDEFGQLIEDITNNVPNINKAVISVHCHDDLGLAAANTLAAVRAGAQQVHCTVNGLGERAGNASLEEVVMALKTRHDMFAGHSTRINTHEIYKTSRLVSTLTGFVVAPNKAIVGGNAFRHESGIHQDGVLKKSLTYEIMNPRDIGWGGGGIVLGKHSGRHAFSKRLEDLGYRLPQAKINHLFVRFKDLADKKKDVFDADIRALAEEEMRPRTKTYRLVSARVTTGTDVHPEAFVKVKCKAKVFEATAHGDGPVDACFKAIDKITKLKTKLMNYKLDAITRGKDALGQVRVEMKIKGKILTGMGASTDIFQASIKAYLDVLNKL